MSAKIVQPPPKAPETTLQAKEAAKQCLVLADKFIKDGDFVKARTEVEKAQKLDPGNVYIFAFKERIDHFEEMKKKTAAAQAQAQQEAAAKAATPAPPASPAPGTRPPSPAPPLSPPPPPGAPGSAPSAPPRPSPPPRMTPPPSATAGGYGSAGDKADLESKLEAMRKQIEMLTNAMDQERKVREEMKQQELQAAAKQLRLAMEKAWMNGAPKEREAHTLHELALSLGIPEDVEHKLRREVKLDMYSRAVKEVVAKRKLIKNSNTTLEWLRKVYQVTLDEYLEYESKFLMDLVADQFKGTILFVSSDEKTARELTTKFKTTGYAVVTAVTPENALEKIEKLIPHFIICDSQFPEASLSGIKFLHLLRINSKFNYLPFILLCTKEEAAQMKSSELRPTEGFLEKPVDFDSLNALMTEKAEQFRSYISSM